MSKLQAGTQRVPESQRDSASKPQVVRGISASAAGYLELPVEIFANLKEEEVAPNDSSTWFDASSGSSASLIPKDLQIPVNACSQLGIAQKRPPLLCGKHRMDINNR